MQSRLPPPLLFFLSLATMEALGIFLPLGQPVDPPLRFLGTPLLLAGVLLHLWAARVFRRRGAPLATLATPGELVVSAPFSLTRNPMYMGGVLILLGVGLFLGAGSPFLVIPAFGFLVRRWYIRPEETHLEREFGGEYLAYRDRVRRWL